MLVCKSGIDQKNNKQNGKLKVSLSAPYGITSVSIFLKVREEDNEPEWPKDVVHTIICKWYPITKKEHDELNYVLA